MNSLNGIKKIQVVTVRENQPRRTEDYVSAEEPLEIRIVAWENGRRQHHRLCVTMRTPGHDLELVSGFLFTENVLSGKNQIEKIAHSTNPTDVQPHNVVNVYLKQEIEFDTARLSRHVYTTSSCGVCGKTSLELVRTACPVPPLGNFQLSGDDLHYLPEILRQGQNVFNQTGGLHAAALFDRHGELLLIREDVGRHNALDKLIGALFFEDRLPAHNSVLLVSGRASFELVQKAAVAGIPIFAAVGAPSSLAIEIAREFDMTLVGFLRKGYFNIYAGYDRLCYTRPGDIKNDSQRPQPCT